MFMLREIIHTAVDKKKRKKTRKTITLHLTKLHLFHYGQINYSKVHKYTPWIIQSLLLGNKNKKHLGRVETKRYLFFSVSQDLTRNTFYTFNYCIYRKRSNQKGYWILLIMNIGYKKIFCFYSGNMVNACKTSMLN